MWFYLVHTEGHIFGRLTHPAIFVFVVFITTLQGRKIANYFACCSSCFSLVFQGLPASILEASAGFKARVGFKKNPTEKQNVRDDNFHGDRSNKR